MKILLDECVDQKLRFLFAEHDCQTAAYAKLAGLKNGNVFLGPDDLLYLTWSCAEDEKGAGTQSLCLAQMADPLHTATATVRIATPTEPWERKSAPIQEGPVGFTNQGSTYITYSASASWTTTDYCVGVLRNTTGDLLNPLAWVKQGPILEGRGKTYGPGSIVFVPSPDGTEQWSLYHAYDRKNCTAWGCRSIHMQEFRWVGGWPFLDYPADPFTPTPLPGGDEEPPDHGTNR